MPLASDAPATAPRSVLLLPLAYMLHLAEEWFGGFTPWTGTVLGNQITTDRFVLINSVALALFILGSRAAVRSPRGAWLGAVLASLLGLNGVLHALATLGFAVYSPGAVTGLLLYVPLSVVILRASASRLSASALASAVLVGVAAHGLVALLAFA